MQPATASPSPYRAVLGDVFATLDARVQRAHMAPLVARGSFDVEHGSHPLTPVLVKILKLPIAGTAQPVQLQVADAGDRVVWMRRIGPTALRTAQYARGTRIVEKKGLGRLEFELRVERGSLKYRQTALSVAGVPVPASIQPRVCACVSGAPHGWHVDVVVSWRDHLVCRYRGLMTVA